MKPNFLEFIWKSPLYAAKGEGEGEGGGTSTKDKDDEASEEDDEEGDEEEEDEEEDSEDDEDEDDEEVDSSKKKKKKGAAADDDLTDEDRKNAVGLFKLLSNPATRDSVIKTMYESAGFKTDGTPAGNKQTKEDFKTLLTESLGNYAFLADKLAPVFDKLLEQVSTKTKKELSSLEERQAEAEVDQALRDLNRQTKGLSRKFENKMAQLAEEMPKGPKTTMASYVRNLFTIASAERGSSNVKKRISDAVNRNRTDVSERLSGGGGSGSSKKGEKGSPAQSGSLRDIFAGAMDKIAKGERVRNNKE